MLGMWRLFWKFSISRPVGDPVKVVPVVDGADTAMTAFRDSTGRPLEQFGLMPIAVCAPIQGVAESEVEASSGS